MHPKLKLGIALFLIGMLGVLSMLTIQLPEGAIPPEISSRFSPQVIRLLILMNPAMLLILSIIAGTMLMDKTGLKVPAISGILRIEKPEISFREQSKYGFVAGIVAGTLITLTALIAQSVIPAELNQLAESMEVTVFARFAYGGITEEILVRFGVMTFFVWAISKISKKLNNSTYMLGIISAALLFAIGHFPAVFGAIPNPSTTMLIYILTGNSIGGIVFGWLYWKKGLEAAFIAHIFAHVAMIIGEKFTGI